jgi:hypothetical protein
LSGAPQISLEDGFRDATKDGLNVPKQLAIHSTQLPSDLNYDINVFVVVRRGSGSAFCHHISSSGHECDKNWCVLRPRSSHAHLQA